MGQAVACTLFVLFITFLTCLVIGMIGLLTCNVKTDGTLDFAARVMRYSANGRNFTVPLSVIDTSNMLFNQTTLRICYAKATPQSFHQMDMGMISIPFGLSVALLVIGGLIITSALTVWIYIYVVEVTSSQNTTQIIDQDAPPSAPHPGEHVSIKADSIQVPHHNVMIGTADEEDHKKNVIVINPSS